MTSSSEPEIPQIDTSINHNDAVELSEQEEPNQQKIQDAKDEFQKFINARFGRRQLLRRIFFGGVALTSADILPAILNFWDQFGAMITGEVWDLDQIPSDVPTSLLLKPGEKIPTRNLQFKQADKVFLEGLQNKDPSTQLHYTKPGNYLKSKTVIDTVTSKIADDPKSLLGGFDTIMGDILSIINTNDVPYSAFLNGSGANINGSQELIINDPGTGIIKKVAALMREQYGDDFDIWSVCNLGNVTEEQLTFIIQEVTKWYIDAMNHIQHLRKENGVPISTSHLFTYFLDQNKGDILASLWDTATWLKILVRNDTSSRDPKQFLRFDPSYERAQMTTDLFADEFSPHISANWVVDHVSPTDPVLNYTGGKKHDDLGYKDKYTKYKDYMPPNRAGGLYHAWNIMALMACADADVVRRMIATHLNPVLSGKKRWSEYGKEKSIADMNVANKATIIDIVLERISRGIMP